jgi:hypothetical protein
MWIALLLCTWFVEGLVGVWLCAHYWMLTQVRYYGSAMFYGPGYDVVWLYNGVMSSWAQAYHLHQHLLVLSQERVALFFVASYIALHVLATVRGLSAPYRQRHRMRSPSKDQLRGGCATMTRECRCALSASCWSSTVVCSSTDTSPHYWRIS